MDVLINNAGIMFSGITEAYSVGQAREQCNHNDRSFDMNNTRSTTGTPTNHDTVRAVYAAGARSRRVRIAI